jgi:hypothetical protein
MTEYERQRQEQILRNRERMMALNLPALAHEMAPMPPRPPSAGAAAKHKGRLGAVDESSVVSASTTI